MNDSYSADQLTETITTCPSCGQEQLHIYKVDGKDCKQCWACDYVEDEE